VIPALQFADAKEEQKNTVSSEEITIIGQFASTYILVEKEKHLILVDQHAAHERILYEQHKNNTQAPATIQLMFPLFVTLSQEEVIKIEPYIQHFIAARHPSRMFLMILQF